MSRDFRPWVVPVRKAPGAKPAPAGAPHEHPTIPAWGFGMIEFERGKRPQEFADASDETVWARLLEEHPEWSSAPDEVTKAAGPLEPAVLEETLRRIEKRRGPWHAGETLFDYMARTATLEERWAAFEKRHEAYLAEYGARETGTERSPMQDEKRAYEQLEAKAVEIRKADRTLTAEKAFVKACEQNPDLYVSARGYSPALAEEPVVKSEAGPPSALVKAAEQLRKADSTLTAEQALVKACERDPRLYDLWRHQ